MRQNRRGSINGWFFGHKSALMVWEQYLDPNGCKRMENLVESCGSYALRQLHHKTKFAKSRKVQLQICIIVDLSICEKKFVMCGVCYYYWYLYHWSLIYI